MRGEGDGGGAEPGVDEGGEAAGSENVVDGEVGVMEILSVGEREQALLDIEAGCHGAFSGGVVRVACIADVEEEGDVAEVAEDADGVGIDVA